MNQGSVYIPMKMLEAVVKGALSPSAVGVYVLLHLQADCRSGIWTGTAEKLEAAFSTLDAAAVDCYLTKLEKARLIRCFRQPARQSLTYVILIHNYLVTDGGFVGQCLNAWKSPDVESLAYEDGTT